MSRHVLTRDGVVVYDFTDGVVVTPVGPPVGPPVVPPPPPLPPVGNYEMGAFVGKGNPDRSDGQHLTLHSGRVKCYPLPDDGSASGTIIMGEVSGSPQPRDMFVCFSKTPGRIDPNTLCTRSDKQIGAVFLTRPVVTGSAGRGGTATIDGSNAKSMGYHWTPLTEGPWYVNVRYDYDEGEGLKPITVEWNNGPY